MRGVDLGEVKSQITVSPEAKMGTDPLNLTFREYLFGPCSESLFYEKAVDSDYWASCLEFFEENEKKVMRDMTGKMRRWAMKIKDDLLEG